MGLTKSKELERLHLQFCKYLLHVKKCTSSMDTYGELGRYPLYIHRYVRIVIYWLKLLRSENKLLTNTYHMILNDLNRGNNNWLSQVRSLLEINGFLHVWINPMSVTEPNRFCKVFKRRLIDCFMQNWKENINNSTSLISYNYFKSKFEFECYLDAVPTDLRIYISKHRLSSHPLRIEVGRYGRDRVERRNRLCLICNNNDIEDEYHFLFVCEKYSMLRKRFINEKWYKNCSMYKFVMFLQTEDRNELIKLGRFLKHALTIRRNVLYRNC